MKGRRDFDWGDPMMVEGAPPEEVRFMREVPAGAVLTLNELWEAYAGAGGCGWDERALRAVERAVLDKQRGGRRVASRRRP